MTKKEKALKNGNRETFESSAVPPQRPEPPTEGKMFEVNPLEIERSIFEKPMSDMEQELTRKLIQKAFIEVDKHPKKHGRSFYTMMPKGNWSNFKRMETLNKCANELGGRIGSWVEQAMEWAQRISNGESWEHLCNEPDTARWYRIVHWKNDCLRIVGGACRCNSHKSPTSIQWRDYKPYYIFSHTVPFVVIKKKSKPVRF